MIPRRRVNSSRISAMERHTRVLTSSWERRNSGLMWPPPRSVQVWSKPAGGFSLTSRVARSTSRYSSSTPTVNGGSVLELATLRRQFGNRQRCRHEEALRKIHTDAFQLIQHRFGLDALGHGRDTQRPAYLADGLDHAPVHGVLGDMADELAIDLEVVHRQRLEVHERRQSTAEVIQRELAA